MILGLLIALIIVSSVTLFAVLFLYAECRGLTEEEWQIIEEWYSSPENRRFFE